MRQVNLRHQARNLDHLTDNDDNTSNFDDGISFLKSEQNNLV
jgi:hypothetical protein